MPAQSIRYDLVNIFQSSKLIKLVFAYLGNPQVCALDYDAVFDQFSDNPGNITDNSKLKHYLDTLALGGERMILYVFSFRQDIKTDSAIAYQNKNGSCFSLMRQYCFDRGWCFRPLLLADYLNNKAAGTAIKDQDLVVSPETYEAKICSLFKVNKFSNDAKHDSRLKVKALTAYGHLSDIAEMLADFDEVDYHVFDDMRDNVLVGLTAFLVFSDNTNSNINFFGWHAGIIWHIFGYTGPKLITVDWSKKSAASKVEQFEAEYNPGLFGGRYGRKKLLRKLSSGADIVPWGDIRKLAFEDGASYDESYKAVTRIVEKRFPGL